MKWLDWISMLVPLTVVAGMAVAAQSRMKSVAGFMTGGRVAGRYLLTVAKGEMAAGAVVFVALFEQIGAAGFTIGWWLWLQVPVLLLVAISGFVIYRYRETRAMTLGQFFEIRYDRNFRVFAGVIGFLAGIANFGIIPAVGARFMVYLLGLPPEVSVFSWSVPSYVPLMALFLGITLFLTLGGGLITLMVTDCLEGIFSQLFYIIIIVALLCIFSWDEIGAAISMRPPGQSMINPLDSLKTKDFNLFYVLIQLFLAVYGTMAWQNASAYNAAAYTPHESRMATILGRWRELGKMAVITLLAVCAVTYLQHPHFAAGAHSVAETVGRIGQPQIREQMTIPVAISEFLPQGIKGIFCAIMIMGIFGGDSTHLHSWGGIFIQDVLLPLRQKPFSPEGHIRALRLSIAGVAVFAFFFGAFFTQTEYISMWFSVTTGIFVGGAGSTIIGGLYWKKGTTAGAWTAMLTGSFLAGGGIVARQIFGQDFPLNGIQISFVAALTASTLYVVVSLLTCREDFNMDRMLHRRGYAVEKRIENASKRKATWERLIGFDENFTLGDKWIAGTLFGWGVFWFSVVIVCSIWNIIAPWPDSVWLTWWHFVGVGLPILLAVITGVWFTWGGLRDMRLLFFRLRHEVVNAADDGTVVGHRNLDDVTPLSDPNPKTLTSDWKN